MPCKMSVDFRAAPLMTSSQQSESSLNMTAANCCPAMTTHLISAEKYLLQSAFYPPYYSHILAIQSSRPHHVASMRECPGKSLWRALLKTYSSWQHWVAKKAEASLIQNCTQMLRQASQRVLCSAQRLIWLCCTESWMSDWIPHVSQQS